MLFRKRDDGEIERIKRAVEEPASFAQDAEHQPSLHDLQVEDLPPELSSDYPEHRESAPLFVKLDKYKELIDTIQEMKSFAGGLKQTFAVLNEAEALRNDALKIMRATVQRLDKSLAAMDAEFVRPRGVDLEKAADAGGDIRYIEGSLAELQRHLAVLRKDLQELRE